MRPTKAVSAALCVCGLLYWGPVTAAQDSEPKSTYWQHDPTERGRWFDPANWSAGTPGPGTYTYVNNGGEAVIYEPPIDGGSGTAGRRPACCTSATARAEASSRSAAC